jgi:ribonuclease HII
MWVVGIDEAGYGPNLGPLVQAAVSLRLPDGDKAGWKTFRKLVRRSHEDDDGRLLIDDSKKVYTSHGLEALERGARAALLLLDPTVGDLIRKTGLDGVLEELIAEAWYDPHEPAPVAAAAEDVLAAFEALSGRLKEGIGFGSPCANVVPAPRFNQICEESGSKGAVLALGAVRLMPSMVNGLPGNNEPVLILCDKHGGRNFYAAMVQAAFPDSWVIVVKESAAESRYSLIHDGRAVTVVFRPRADGDSIAVALASMLCKYLREVCMRQFNRFWGKHVPGIEPTAGYPGDSRRFYDQIKPAMTKLGFTEDQVWRKR